jgi:hypothetical protein
LCGHFENDSISALRTTRFRFENDSFLHPTDITDEFRLDFFRLFLSAKKPRGVQTAFELNRTLACAKIELLRASNLDPEKIGATFYRSRFNRERFA